MAYSLDLFVNSATTELPANPQPTNPPSLPPGPYYRAWKWEWRKQDSVMQWVDPGNLVLRLERNEASGLPLCVTTWDLPWAKTSPTAYVSIASLNQVTMVFNFGTQNPGSSPFAGQGYLWNGQPLGQAGNGQGGLFPTLSNCD